MLVKKVEGASLKAQIFLYYAGELENKKCTLDFPDFEQDDEPFKEIAESKLREGFEGTVGYWTWEEYRKSFYWVYTSEIKIQKGETARRVREELIADGFLWKKVYEKPWGRSGKGLIRKTYIGLTEKGKYWAPKYIAKYGKVTVEDFTLK